MSLNNNSNVKLDDSSSLNSSRKMLHPDEVLKIHRLKIKKKQLQARIQAKKNTESDSPTSIQYDQEFPSKRKNPFLKTCDDNKRTKQNEDSFISDETCDQTLFKLMNLGEQSHSKPLNFTNLFENVQESSPCTSVTVEDKGKKWIPIDWSLKSKVRLLSSKPFAWNKKLKISEEASGITGFVRCLDKKTQTNLDISPNANFHKACLYWQHPSLPWLNLFPRMSRRLSETNNEISIAASSIKIRDSLYNAWCNSLRSLFQMVRTRQCPYFYVCSNHFTILIRAPGLSGFKEINACVTPTTRGFRQLLKEEDIEYSMPLKNKRISDQGCAEVLEEDEDVSDEKWLESMGVNADDIKKINYTQSKMVHKAECEIDNSEQSLVYIEGMEVNALYNFLMNSKSVVNISGSMAGIPPTLLAPIAFHGATLSSLNVKQNQVKVDGVIYHSMELAGPILPQFSHNLCAIHSQDQNLSLTFANVDSTLPFSKIKYNLVKCVENKGDKIVETTVFDKENLSDCGFNYKLLKHFCSSDLETVAVTESLKYDNETKNYIWL